MNPYRLFVYRFSLAFVLSVVLGITAVPNAFAGLIQDAGGAVSRGTQAVGEAAAHAGQVANGAVSQAGQAVGDAASHAAQVVTSAAPQLVKDAAGNVLNTVKDAEGTLVTTATNASGIVVKTTTVVGGITTILEPNAAGHAIRTVIDARNYATVSMVDQAGHILLPLVVGAGPSVITSIDSQAQNMWTYTVDSAGHVINTSSLPYGQWLSQVRAGVAEGLVTVSAGLGSAIANVGYALKSFDTIVVAIGDGLVEAIIQTGETAFDAAQRALYQATDLSKGDWASFKGVTISLVQVTAQNASLGTVLKQAEATLADAPKVHTPAYLDAFATKIAATISPQNILRSGDIIVSIPALKIPTSTQVFGSDAPGDWIEQLTKAGKAVVADAGSSIDMKEVRGDLSDVWTKIASGAQAGDKGYINHLLNKIMDSSSGPGMTSFFKDVGNLINKGWTGLGDWGRNHGWVSIQQWMHKVFDSHGNSGSKCGDDDPTCIKAFYAYNTRHQACVNHAVKRLDTYNLAIDTVGIRAWPDAPQAVTLAMVDGAIESVKKQVTILTNGIDELRLNSCDDAVLNGQALTAPMQDALTDANEWLQWLDELRIQTSIQKLN
ncbi:MAG: hypothetical protein NTZ90_06470 [Proteobacteria bacterium]|nr:hypothetical protein [Pseudomonadota bacterium]